MFGLEPYVKYYSLFSISFFEDGHWRLSLILETKNAKRNLTFKRLHPDVKCCCCIDELEVLLADRITYMFMNQTRTVNDGCIKKIG